MRLWIMEATLGRCWLALAGLLAFLMVSMPISAQAADILLRLRLPDGKVIGFTDAQLRGMEWTAVSTSSRWTEGVKRFEGPTLRAVLLASGLPEADLQQRSLLLSALNDFHIGVEGKDAWTYNPILARTVDGEPMRVRDKGPLWLVYPRDSYRALQNSLADERWIWQLSEITIR